jgi:hypothetical protein
MVIGAGVVTAISIAGVTAEDLLFVVAGMCLVSAWLALKLHRACFDGCPAGDCAG